jgi:hypothetical protein
MRSPCKLPLAGILHRRSAVVDDGLARIAQITSFLNQAFQFPARTPNSGQVCCFHQTGAAAVLSKSTLIMPAFKLPTYKPS